VAVTRFGLEGYGVRRAGSFAGKSAAPTHPVGRLTRFGLEGYGVRRAGSFAGKTEASGDNSGTRRQRSIKALVRRRTRRC
jgi:hypothetical protein